MPLHPLFVHGALTSGQLMAWAVEPVGAFHRDRSLRPAYTAVTGRVRARVRGRLWRMPCGDTLLELDPDAGWVDGEIVPRPTDARLHLLETLLGCRQRRISLAICPARTGNRAVNVAAFAASARDLERLGARAIRSKAIQNAPTSFQRA